jgi:5-methylthioadenosine/S-adenosylhomocysteine deaminase
MSEEIGPPRDGDEDVARSPTLVIRGCDALVAPGDLRTDVDLAIAGDRITAVGATSTRRDSRGGDARSAGAPGRGRELDGRGLLAIPGLVNAHTHSPENCLRGSGVCLPLESWLTRMFGVAGQFSPQDHYACALAGAVEMLGTGTTAVLDHLWGTPPSIEGAEATLSAYRDAGMRAAVAPLVADADFTAALAERHHWDLSGALFTDLAGSTPAHEAVAQIDALARDWHDRETRRLQVFAGPCGVQWCSDELLAGLAESARRHDTSLTIHLLETRLQDCVARERFGVTAVRALERLGLLEARCSLAHGVWIDPSDLELIADRGSAVVHNPAANLRLGSGRAAVPEMLAAGVTIALGSDGTACSDNTVIWTQIKLASLVHNDFAADRWVSPRDALTMATTGGAAALGLTGSLGRLEPGALADITLVDRRGEGLAGVSDLEAGLALSETGRGVVHTIVAGEPVVVDRRCEKVDAVAARAALAEQAERRRASGASVPPAILDAMERLERFKRLVENNG